MEVSDSPVVAALIWACLCAPIFVCATVMIWRLRNKYNIKARGTLAMVGQSVAYLGFFLWVCVGLSYSETEVLCSATIGSGIFVNILSLINILRLWVLMFRFRIAAKLVSCGAKRPMDLDSDTPTDTHNSRVSDNNIHIKDQHEDHEQQLVTADVGPVSQPTITSEHPQPLDALDSSAQPSAATISAAAAAIELEHLKQLHAGASTGSGSGVQLPHSSNEVNNTSSASSVVSVAPPAATTATSAATATAAAPTVAVQQPFRRLHGIMSGPDSWFIRHRYLITKPWLAALFTIPLLLLTSIAIPVVMLPSTCSDARTAAQFYSNGFIIFWCILVVSLTMKIRKTDGDAFGIRTELRATAFVAILAIAVTVPIGYFYKNSILGASLSNIFILGCYSTSTLWPLYIAFRTSEDTVTFQGLRDISTLADLLELDLGYESFLNYATHEFAQENVLFWKAVQQFIHKYGQVDYFAITRRTECMTDARHIINQYVADKAPSQVNLPAQVRLDLLQNWHAELIRDASSMDLMSSGMIAGFMEAGNKPSYKPAPIQIPQPKHLLSQHQSPVSTASTDSTLSSTSHHDVGHSQPLLASDFAASSPGMATGVGVTDATGKKYSPTSVSVNAISETSVSVSNVSTSNNGKTLKPAPTSASGEGHELRLTVIPEQPSSHRRHHTSGGANNSSLSDEDEEEEDGEHANGKDKEKPVSASHASQIKHKKDTSNSRGLLTTLSVATIFNQAAEEVYHLMCNDLLPRYLKSRDFVEFLQKMKEKMKNSEKEPSVSRSSGVLQSKAQLYRPVALNVSHAHLAHLVPMASSTITTATTTNASATYSIVSTASPTQTPVISPAPAGTLPDLVTRLDDDVSSPHDWTVSPLVTLNDGGSEMSDNTVAGVHHKKTASSAAAPSPSLSSSNVLQSPSPNKNVSGDVLSPLSSSIVSINNTNPGLGALSISSTVSSLPPLPNSRPTHAPPFGSGHSHHASTLTRRSSSSHGTVNGVGVVHSSGARGPHPGLKRDQSISTLASLPSPTGTPPDIQPSPLTSQRPIVRMDLTLGTRLTEQPLVNLQDIVITDSGAVEIASNASTTSASIPANPTNSTNSILGRLPSPSGNVGANGIPAVIAVSPNKRDSKIV